MAMMMMFILMGADNINTLNLISIVRDLMAKFTANFLDHKGAKLLL